MLAHVKTPQRHIPPTKENPLGKFVFSLWGDGGSCSNLLEVITQKGTYQAIGSVGNSIPILEDCVVMYFSNV